MAEEPTNGAHCDVLLEGNGKSLSGSTEKKRRKSVTHIFSAKIKRKKDSALIQEDFLPDLAAVQNLVTTKGKEIIQRRYSGGRTALHIVAEKGDLKTIEYLHSVHAKLDAIDDCGWTALHWACYMGNMDIIMFLIAAGASCIVITEEGDLPLHLFISKASPVSLFLFFFYFLYNLFIFFFFDFRIILCLVWFFMNLLNFLKILFILLIVEVILGSFCFFYCLWDELFCY